jgi:hypothetical protein
MSLTLPRISAIVFLAALLTTEPVASQAPQQPPIFRAEANLVEVIVRVTGHRATLRLTRKAAPRRSSRSIGSICRGRP